MDPLLQRIRRRDVEALKTLYRVQAPRILAYLAQYIEDAESCHALLEASFVDLWNQREPAHEDAFTALALLARARLAERLQRMEAEPEPESPRFAPSETLPGWFRVRRERLPAALASLHGTERECLHLALVEDLPLADMATVLGCAEDEVMRRLLLARRRLRKALTGGDPLDVA